MVNCAKRINFGSAAIFIGVALVVNLSGCSNKQHKFTSQTNSTSVSSKQKNSFKQPSSPIESLTLECTYTASQGTTHENEVFEFPGDRKIIFEFELAGENGKYRVLDKSEDGWKEVYSYDDDTLTMRWVSTYPNRFTNSFHVVWEKINRKNGYYEMKDLTGIADYSRGQDKSWWESRYGQCNKSNGSSGTVRSRGKLPKDPSTGRIPGPV